MVMLLLLAYGVVAPAIFGLRALPFDSDEGLHAANALALAVDLRNGRLGQALYGLYYQDWYPPGLSLYLAPFILVLGPERWAVRYPLLLMFVLGVALLYRVGKRLWRDDCAAMGAAFLAATSPLFWMQAALCMEKSLTLVGVLVTIAVYARVVEEGRGWLWVGVAAATTFLLRTTAGIFLLFAVAWALVVYRGQWVERRLVLKALGPGVLVAAGWWISPHKIAQLGDYFLASAPQYPEFTLAALLNYWNHLLLANSVGLGTGLVLVTGLILSLRRWRQPRVGFLLAMALGIWVALVLKRQNANRLFYVALPAVYLLASDQALAAWRWLRACLLCRSACARRMGMVGLLYLFAAVVVRIATFPLLMAVTYETGPGLAEAGRWVAAQVDTSEAWVLLINGWDQFSAPALEWAVWERRWHADGREPLEVLSITLRDPDECDTCVDDFQRAASQRPGVQLVHLANTPVPAAGAWWAYEVAIAPLWSGVWTSSATFDATLWDGELKEAILAHPMRFLGRTAEEVGRTFRYALSFEVHTTRLAARDLE